MDPSRETTLIKQRFQRERLTGGRELSDETAAIKIGGTDFSNSIIKPKGESLMAARGEDYAKHLFRDRREVGEGTTSSTKTLSRVDL